MTKTLLTSDPLAIPRALEVLRAGGIVAFPTDTVYGLGALAFDVAGIERLYDAKGREHTKAIAVLIADPGELSKVASSVGEQAARLTAEFWPGPLTLVVPKLTSLPGTLSPNDTIGVRVPDHAAARALLAAAGPMAVTSANRSGGPNARTAAEVLVQLDGRVELVLDGGQTPGDTPSTVVDLTGAAPKMLRIGPISEAAITAALAK
jgi:L-threonylcarbamoyladenylate synthase